MNQQIFLNTLNNIDQELATILGAGCACTMNNLEETQAKQEELEQMINIRRQNLNMAVNAIYNNDYKKR